MQILKRRSDAIYLTEMGAFIARRINFYSVFRKEYDTTPKEYRERYSEVLL
nr:hypothetical protein [Enterobacter hormaechei]